MKAYHLIVMYPGMSSLRPIIKADGFYIDEGAYFFYLKARKTICTYPVCLTIIHSIEIINNV